MRMLVERAVHSTRKAVYQNFASHCHYVECTHNVKYTKGTLFNTKMMQLLQKNLKTRCLQTSSPCHRVSTLTAFCICVQMRACRSWLWSSFSWDSSVRWGEFIIMTPLTWTRLKAASDTYYLTTPSLRFRAISRDLHPFSKRPSQSSTAGTALSIRWLFPRSGGLVRPSFSPPRPLTTGLAFFCSTSELQESFDGGGSLGLVADRAACCCIFWWGKSCHYVVVAFYRFFRCCFFPPPTQYSHLLLF